MPQVSATGPHFPGQGSEAEQVQVLLVQTPGAQSAFVEH
jgi:hypothetical protein